MDIRTSIQSDAKEAFLNSERKNSIIVGTGGGKSKIAIDILKEINPNSILLLTNSQTLRDENWKKEFEKFDYPWDKVVSECYQTAYKWEGKHFEFIIADEGDFIADEYVKVFTNNTYDNLLLMTGFLPEEKKELIESIAPVCFTAVTEELQETGLLNESEIIIVEYNLSKKKDLMVPKGKSGAYFYTSENDSYRYYDKEFSKAVVVKSAIEKKYKLFPNPEILKSLSSADWKFKVMASKRKSILNNLNSSVEVVKEIVKVIHSKPNNKVLIFSALTKQCDKLINPFHGKSNEDVSGIEDLNENKINTLSVCKKINRGINLTGVNYSIRESFDGSEVDFHQTHGRLMRLPPGQKARYLILVPYYSEPTRNPGGFGYTTVKYPTQAKKWADNMMKNFSSDNVRTIRLTSDNKLPADHGLLD